MVNDHFLVRKIREPVIHLFSHRKMEQDQILRSQFPLRLLEFLYVIGSPKMIISGSDFVRHTLFRKQGSDRQTLITDGVPIRNRGKKLPNLPHHGTSPFTPEKLSV